MQGSPLSPLPAMATASMSLMRAATSSRALARSWVRGSSTVPSRWGGPGTSRDAVSPQRPAPGRHNRPPAPRFAAAADAEDADASTSTSADGASAVVAKVGGGDAPSPPAPSVPARDPSTPPEPDTPAVPLGIASSGAVLVPHPDKAEKGGEDACFVLRDQGAFGVMDGVGGWADEGVDPAAYSNTFAERSAAAVLMGASDPREVIRAAHERVKIVGSTTACVAILDGENAIVNVGNLGDAGAMIARGKEDYFRTPSQQHEFNCPFQLGCAEFYPESDGADDAETFSVHVRPGDALVMGSDGLWDNVPHAEVAQTVEACVRGGKDAQETAEAIATLAFEHSVDEEYDSPFTTEARNNGYDVEWWEKAKGKVLVGGKMDDIAVVVAFMDEKEKCPPPAPEDEDEDGTEARV